MIATIAAIAEESAPQWKHISQNALQIAPQDGVETDIVFLEEIQKYDCLYNKFSKDYKSKYKKLNCWSKIGEKFDVDPAEAGTSVQRIYGRLKRYLKPKESQYLLVVEGMLYRPTQREFANSTAFSCRAIAVIKWKPVSDRNRYDR